MIDVQRIFEDIPHFDTFCSVEALHALAERLRSDARFEVRVAGQSVNGVPIHHICFGKGSVKALFVGYQHGMEPVNGLTIFSLLTLLRQNHEALSRQGIEWHFVPCIDPDGKLLNEGWMLKPFTFANYMRNFHQQPWPEQVDFTFPISYKKLKWDKPSKEAEILRGVLDRVRPDFFYHGHDARPTIGSWYYISRNIDKVYYRQLQSLMEQCRMPLNVGTMLRQFEPYDKYVYPLVGLKEVYDRMEKADASLPERALADTGSSSYEYLEEIKPGALSFTGEVTNIRYLGVDLSRETAKSLRQILLHLAADNKFIASLVLEEWDNVKDDLDASSPFYRKIAAELIAHRGRLHEGLNTWYETPAQSLLSDPSWSRAATKGDCVDAYIGLSGRFGFLCQAYEFVRLLRVSKQTALVNRAIDRLELAFDDALKEIDAKVDLSKFEAVDCTTLARAHACSGLIALNAVLEAHAG